jgi:hypothetical protein
MMVNLIQKTPPVDLFNDGIANNHGSPYMGDIEREYHFLYTFVHMSSVKDFMILY